MKRETICVLKKAGIAAATAAACGYMLIAWASPPLGVTPTLIGRGTYQPFDVKAHDRALGFKAKARHPVDMVVRTHAYAPGSSTGWHTHPGPVFITVLEGQVTFYEVDDPTCTPTRSEEHTSELQSPI